MTVKKTKPKKKPTKKKTTPNPPSSKKRQGSQPGYKRREIYPLEVAINLFSQAKDILIADPDIITETELAFRCKDALSLPYSSYRYLSDEKFKLELADHKKEIESILETRVMKSKEMYPGIAAMTLKNKHGWKDEKQLDLKGDMKIEIIDHYDEEYNDD